MIGGNTSTASVHSYYYLTSPIFDGSGFTGIELSLWRWLNSDYTPYMQNRVEVYNGVEWVVLWETQGSPGVQDSEWAQMTFDVSEHANDAMQMRVGFSVGSTGVYTCGGWNVDDVTVTVTEC